MDFDPTDEQRMLAETVNSLLDKRYDPASRLKLLDSELGWSRELWQQYAQLGLLGLTFDEQYDGAGMGGAELATVMESFGRALVLEPFFPTVVLGGTLVSQAGHAGAEVGHPAAGGGGRAAARVRLRRARDPLVADRHRHHRGSVRGQRR